MWWPILNEDHVARQQACRIRSTPRIWFAPEDYSPIFVLRISQYVVQYDSEAIQMTDMQRSEIRVEAVVEQFVINSKVDWRVHFWTRGRKGGTIW